MPRPRLSTSEQGPLRRSPSAAPCSRSCSPRWTRPGRPRLAIKDGTTFDAIAEERKLSAKDTGPRPRHAGRDHRPQGRRSRFRHPAGNGQRARRGPVWRRAGPRRRGAARSGTALRGGGARDQGTRSPRAGPRNALQDAHDKIEDQRASAKPLADIAKDQKLTLQVSTGGSRRPRQDPEAAGVARAREPAQGRLRLRYRSRQRGRSHPRWRLCLVRSQSESSRPGSELLPKSRPRSKPSGRMTRSPAASPPKASELVKKANDGVAMATLAAEVACRSSTAQGIKRPGENGGLPQAAVARSSARRSAGRPPLLARRTRTASSCASRAPMFRPCSRASRRRSRSTSRSASTSATTS